MSAGTLVLGLLNGLIIGLLAVGFVLVYKANKFLNLAHAQLGTLSALVLAKGVLDWGWSFWPAFVGVIAGGAAVGLLVERLIVQRLRQRTQSPVALLLLSLAISQVLLASSFLPGLIPSTTARYPQPFSASVRVGGVVLNGMAILSLILVPILVIALALFMRLSVVGKQVRAAANNPEAARLCGISVGRVSALTWAIAGGFSAVSAVLIAPNQAGYTGGTFGPLLLLLTVGAAAFGAFVSLPGALAGGLLLGMVQQITAGITSNGAKAELAAFITILLIVFVRGRSIAAAFASSGSVADDLPPVRVPAVLRGAAIVRHRSLVLGGLALVLGVLWPQLPYFSSPGNQFRITLVLIFAVLGISLTMLLGWAGQVSLGSFGVTGICAYLTVQKAGDGWPITTLLLLSAGVGALAMVLVGLPALRVRGLTLAVTTLGLAVLTTDYALHQSWLGGESSYGVSFSQRPSIGRGLGTPSSPEDTYYLALAVLVLAGLGASALRRSLPGRLVVAVRDNERASASFGVSPATIKLAILATSGAFAGVAGVLWAESRPLVSATQFTADVSIGLVAIPVIGGLGSVAGAIAAAVFIYGLAFFVGPQVSFLFGDFGNNLAFTLALAGVGQIAVLLKLPTGMAGAAQAQWQAYLDRRGAQVAAARAEVDADLPLRVRDVRVHFGGVTALDGPDIEVRAGEIVGLIGTNGAGKTTLMNVISGVISPNVGSVEVFGNEVVDLPPDFRASFGLARSFQDATLFAGLTVTETIQVALSRTAKVGFLSSVVGAPWALTAQRRTRQQAGEIVERFGLGGWADARTVDLSTGTRRIVDLAAQVATGPRVLLLDEPTAGVAQREAEAFGPLLRRIRDDLDCAILIVEHDMPLLMQLCDRVYALETGRVIAEGTPEQVRSDPRVVASYLGTDETAIDRSGAGGRTPVAARTARPRAAAKPPAGAAKNPATQTPRKARPAAATATAGATPRTRRFP